jgi:predicted RNase H-like HicB family nuclease
MENHILQNVVWKEGKYYVAQCLNIDISSFGESREDALKNLDEALNLYFEDDKHEDIQSVENPEIIHLSVKYA